MPPSPPAAAGVRSSAVVNEEIRALIRRARGRSLGASERLVYERLLLEWTRAVEAEASGARGCRFQADVTPAA